MIEMSLENINGIEVIHSAPAGQRQQPLPTIFFYHATPRQKRFTPISPMLSRRQGFALFHRMRTCMAPV